MGEILHVVVGAGLPHYFRNALLSALRETEDDVLGIYNQISPVDCPDTGDIESFFGDRFALKIEPNSLEGRTGSLYDSYNLAIDYARGRYDFVHFLQGDMQLMYWPKNQVVEIEKLFRDLDSPEPTFGRLFCLAIYAPARGFDPRFATTVVDGESVGPVWMSTSRAMVDSSVLSMRLIEENGFKFFGDEDQVNQHLFTEGWRLGYLKKPVTAFVPWPAVVRKGRVRGQEVAVTESRSQLLALRNDSVEDALQSDEEGIVWAEDLVKPNGWSCFYPYWLTELRYWSDVKARRSACKQLSVSFWAVDGELLSSSWRGFFSIHSIPMSGPRLLAKVLWVAAKEPVKVFLGFLLGLFPGSLKKKLPHRLFRLTNQKPVAG